MKRKNAIFSLAFCVGLLFSIGIFANHQTANSHAGYYIGQWTESGNMVTGGLQAALSVERIWEVQFGEPSRVLQLDALEVRQEHF